MTTTTNNGTISIAAGHVLTIGNGAPSQFINNGVVQDSGSLTIAADESGTGRNVVNSGGIETLNGRVGSGETFVLHANSVLKMADAHDFHGSVTMAIGSEFDVNFNVTSIGIANGIMTLNSQPGPAASFHIGGGAGIGNTGSFSQVHPGPADAGTHIIFNPGT